MTSDGDLLYIDGADPVPLEIADDGRARRRGLLGRDGLDGALLLRANSVHTVAMRFAIDVALCSSDLRVHTVLALTPNRVTRPRWGIRYVVEAPWGSFSTWGIVPGTQLRVERRSAR